MPLHSTICITRFAGASIVCSTGRGCDPGFLVEEAFNCRAQVEMGKLSYFTTWNFLLPLSTSLWTRRERVTRYVPDPAGFVRVMRGAFDTVSHLITRKPLAIACHSIHGCLGTYLVGSAFSNPAPDT